MSRALAHAEAHELGFIQLVQLAKVANNATQVIRELRSIICLIRIG
jgi:hypothetical protein